MPIYEYICLDCGNRFESMRSMKDADAPIPCRQCAGEHTSRLLSIFSAHSGGKVVAGSASTCSSCTSSSCATCKN